MRNKQIKKLDELGVSGTVTRELLGKGLNKQGKLALKAMIKEHKRIVYQLSRLHNSIPNKD